MQLIVNPVFVRLKGTSKIYGFRNNFCSFSGNKSKANLSAEYERNAKLLYIRYIHRSLTFNQQAKIKAFNQYQAFKSVSIQTSLEACKCQKD